MSSIVVAGDTSGSITISAPAVSGSNTLSLPAVTDTLAGIAATQTLTNKTLTSPTLTSPALGTVASGNISACTSSGMVMVAPALGTPASGVLTNCTGVAKAALPAGSVLQVVQATKTDAMAAVAGAQWANVPGQGGVGTFSATITPTSASNKILVIVDMKGSGLGDTTVIRSRLIRGATPIYIGDASGSAVQGMGQFYITTAGSGSPSGSYGFYLAQLGGTYLDSPATTSATTYTMQYGSDSNAQTSYINRTQGDRGAAYYDIRCAASIILMEIAG